MSTPVDEFLEEYGPVETKQANFRTDFGKAMISGLGAGAATAAIGAGAIGMRSLMAAATKSRDFRLMLEHNQDLAEHHQADPKRFNQMYSSLHTMNPTFARDPIVAGTYMRQMVENPLAAGGILAQTVGARGAFPSVLDQSAERAGATASSYMANRAKAPDADPHAAQAQRIRGMELAQKERQLGRSAQQQGMRDEIEDYNLAKDHAHAKSPIFSPIRQR